MDDPDKDLTHLFVRDLDEIALPERGAWRPQARKERLMTRTSRYLVNTAAVAAVLVLALVVGYQLQQRQEVAVIPSSSPSASASAVQTPSVNTGPATATPGASAAPSSIYNDDFGFIVSENGQDIIRKESSNARGPSFSTAGFAVSPDGTRFAYWSQGATEAAGARTEIRIVSVANPTSTLFSSALSDNERPGGIVWSNDSAGIAYAIQTGNPVSASVVRIALLSGPLAKGAVAITWNDAGRILQPVAYDHSANVVAAGVTGDGGFMTTYIVARPGAQGDSQQQFDVTGRVSMGSVKPSTDAKLVVGVDIDSGFSYWPIADYSAKVTPAESKYGSTGALWRPGTHEIGFIGPSNQFWLCNADRNTPLGCGSTAFSGVPDGAFVRLFRADGSAVLLAVVRRSPEPGQADYTLVKFTGDPLAAKSTGGERVTFTDVSTISASVKLR